MELIDRKILDGIQKEIPLVEQPFAELAIRVGLSETELIARLRFLKEQRMIRQISGIFDAHSLGYQSALVAMKIVPTDLEAAAAVINRHPGVSHNYLRDHAFNLWFTISMFPDRFSLESHVEILAVQAASSETLILPALRLYKIGVNFPIGDSKEQDDFYSEASRPYRPLMPWERRVVRVLQQDLPLDSEPFFRLAREGGIDQSTLLQAGERLKKEGFLRRFAAVLNHREVGYTANLMTVWKITEKIHRIGMTFASLPYVSHCYQRPTFPNWPYNLFAMIHAKTDDECDRFLQEMSGLAGASEHAALTSLKEFKKVRTPYFTGEQEEWEANPG